MEHSLSDANVHGGTGDRSIRKIQISTTAQNTNSEELDYKCAEILERFQFILLMFYFFCLHKCEI